MGFDPPGTWDGPSLDTSDPMRRQLDVARGLQRRLQDISKARAWQHPESCSSVYPCGLCAALKSATECVKAIEYYFLQKQEQANDKVCMDLARKVREMDDFDLRELAKQYGISDVAREHVWSMKSVVFQELQRRKVKK